VAKISYIGGGSHARGMLRAVVTLEQLNSLVPQDGVSYLGTEFPELKSDDPITVNRRAKYYELTHSGRKQLRSETTAWRKLTAAVDQILETA
jgi:hypothetical protein